MSVRRSSNSKKSRSSKSTKTRGRKTTKPMRTISDAKADERHHDVIAIADAMKQSSNLPFVEVFGLNTIGTGNTYPSKEIMTSAWIRMRDDISLNEDDKDRIQKLVGHTKVRKTVIPDQGTVHYIIFDDKVIDPLK